MTVANPIYDIVFKYLMEDERIAKTILSALLKEDVVDVKVRRNEYSNSNRENLSIFRIDFGATIRKGDGSLHLVLIELQKTWLETETLRFRQYLGVHYANPENILPESKEGYAIPMITVYLLGHKVGDIEEPVLYVRRNSYDYDDNLVTKGLPDPFIDSLTHDSIIVQIPRLHGQINNRLEKVLSVFDQTYMDGRNKHVLHLDEKLYLNDDEMMHIVHRLLEAASDTQMRHEMNVEDEYFSVIEKRDTTIMLKDKQIARQTATIKEQGDTIKEQGDTIKEQGDTIKEQGDTIKEQGDTIKEQGDTIKEQGDTIKEQGDTIKEQGDTIKEQGDTIKEQGDTIKEQQGMLKTTIRMLMEAGMTAEQIAANLGVDLDFVKQY